MKKHLWKRFFSIAAALLLIASAAPAAWGALADLGIPIDPHGYPAYYQDGAGLQLELCLPPPAGNASRADLCVFSPLDTNSPILVTGESFWWMADSEIAMPGGGRARLILGIEGTFGGAEAPIDGQQIAFGRTRIRIDTPVAGTYTITHPYATQVFEVTDVAAGINYTADIGGANFLSPAIGFRGTLAAPIGPFLTWPNYATNPALQVRAADGVTVLEQYVGDPNVPSPVVGGPNGNLFRIQGPAGSGIDLQTDQFFVMGKVFDPTVPQVAHVFPGAPEQKLLALGPVNRVAPFALPTTGAVTGTDEAYSVGYPLWYQENLGTLAVPVPGVQLTLCTPGDAMCISDPINPTNPTQAALRTGGEAFWWSADARIDVPAGRALLVLGLEGTFGGDESLIDGQQIAFGRVRVRVDTDTAGTYRVTHPYGQLIFENVPAGIRGINYTADVGIADPADPDGAFVGGLYSDIGPTFLKWTTFNPDPALTDPLLVTPHATDPLLKNYHVGNPGIERAVTGSPFGTNFFRVERQVGGNWLLVGQTSLFAVSGKIYDPATFAFAGNPAAPVANPDAAILNLALAASATINVLANDTFAAGAPVTVTIVTPPASGTAVVNNPAGTVTYTPGADLAAAGGTDNFTYNIVDGSGLTSNIALVTIVPVIPVEVITVRRARLDQRRLEYEFQGAANIDGATLTIYPGASAAGAPLGTAIVNLGQWRLRATAASNLGINSISIVSSNGGTLLNQPLQFR